MSIPLAAKKETGLLAATRSPASCHHHLPGLSKSPTTPWGSVFLAIRGTPFVVMKSTYKAIKTPRHKVTPDYVKECFEYDPSSGKLTWKERPPHHFPTDRGWRIFNRCYAGNETGSKDNMGYLIVLIGGRPYPAHRVIWAWMKGEWPPEMVDHINGVRDDNRWCNLRKATREENRWNSFIRKDNSTGVKGVGKPVIRADGRPAWRAVIRVNKVVKHLGYFASKEDAAKVVKEAREKLHGEFAHHG